MVAPEKKKKKKGGLPLTSSAGTTHADESAYQEKLQKDLDRDLAEAVVTASPAEKARVATALLRALVRIHTLALDSGLPYLLIPALTGLTRYDSHVTY